MNESGEPIRELTITVEPDPPSLTGGVLAHASRISRDSGANRFRSESALPLNRPIVMTGHQANWRHAGIVAKYIACQSLAESLGGASAWVVPDQDEVDFQKLPVPVRDASGVWRRRSLLLATSVSAGIAQASLPAFRVNRPELDEHAPAWVRASVESLLDSLHAHRHEQSAAKQVSRALDDLTSPLAGRAPTLFASTLHQTTRFAELVAHLREDAHDATSLYNDAIAQTPAARVAPLRRDTRRGRYELPLWRLAPGQTRRAVFSDELDEIPLSELAPKAILFTGLLRLVACDLFIHGVGGGVYDRITEGWLCAWLGAELAPAIVVSATMYLPLVTGETPVPPTHMMGGETVPPAHPADPPALEAIARARAAAHHAAHHPGDIGLDALQLRRDKLVEDIRRAKHAGESPAPIFRELHNLLAEYHEQNHVAIESLRHRSEALEARRAESEVVWDRTWAFFLHEPAALERLTGAVRARLATVALPVR